MTSERKMFPKQQLEIVQVHEEKSYGTAGKALLPVKAKNLSLHEGDPLIGKPLKHTIFNPELVAFVKQLEPGARFLCDVEERERPDTEYGPDRNIVQIYVNGEPVSKKKPGGGGSYRLSLDDEMALEAVKRRSIEGQTSIAQVGQVLTSPTPIPGEGLGISEDEWKRILGKYWKAIERGLDNYLAEPKKTRETAPKPIEKAQDAKPGAGKPTAEVSHDIGNPPVEEPIKHIGDLLTRANKLTPPVTREELVVALNVKDPSEIKGLKAAWKMAREISATKVQGQPKVGEKLF